MASPDKGRKPADATAQTPHASPDDYLSKTYADLAASLLSRDNLTEAEHAFARAFEQDPVSPESHFNLGLLLSQQARHEEALAAFRHAAMLRPDWPDAHNSMGAELGVLDRTADAEAAFRTALALQPALAAAWCNLGQLLADTGRGREAVAALHQAIAHGALSAHVHFLLASELIALGEHAQAEQQLRRTLELDADHAMAALNLVDLLRISNRVDEAEAYARAVVEQHPQWAMGYFALGNVAMSKGIGNPGLAVSYVQRAVELDPDSLSSRVNLAYLQIFASEDGHAVLNECRALTARFEEPFLRTTIAYRNDPTPSRRLRIGYVSPDFREHCQTLFMTPLLKHHDHGQVEVYGYASVRNPDAFTQQLAGFADVWRDVSSLDDNQLALQILDDKIDILVDLTMHMSNGRPLLFARRPAPVQVAWLAYPGTTGSKAIGYRLTDPWLDPPGDTAADDRYSERSLRLPDTFWCYDPLTTEPEPGPLPAERHGYVTFGCLNNPHKLTDRTFALWARVLNDVPGSRLRLLLPDGSTRDIVQKKFEQLGVDGSRLNLVRFQKREDYLRTYQSIDIALDVFPYNGHTTSLDALWMGVPVVTVIGRMPASRAGYSLLSNVGLSELAAPTDADFAACATRLASDLPALAKLRAGLRARMEASPLMDGARFARGMEAAYRQMWTEWCDTQGS